MVHTADEKDLKRLASEMVGEFKSEKDSGAFTKALRKQFWETTLEGEMDDHLGYEKNDSKGNNSGNSRNAKSSKRLKGEHGDLEIDTPRDRNGTFSPQVIGKRESRARGIDDKILYLYAKGQSTRDIVDIIEELYDVSISPSLISRVTDRGYGAC